MLTQGSLLKATLGTLDIDQPVVQCVQVKPMNNATGVERWRVVMNDGVNFMQGMLSVGEFA
jgi:replication factor A1